MLEGTNSEAVADRDAPPKKGSDFKLAERTRSVERMSALHADLGLEIRVAARVKRKTFTGIKRKELTIEWMGDLRRRSLVVGAPSGARGWSVGGHLLDGNRGQLDCEAVAEKNGERKLYRRQEECVAKRIGRDQAASSKQEG